MEGEASGAAEDYLGSGTRPMDSSYAVRNRQKDNLFVRLPAAIGQAGKHAEH